MPTSIGLTRDTGVLTFASAIDTVYPTWRRRAGADVGTLLVETFIETDGVAAGKPQEPEGRQTRAAVLVDLSPDGSGPDRRCSAPATRPSSSSRSGRPGSSSSTAPTGPLIIAIEPAADSTIEAVLPGRQRRRQEPALPVIGRRNRPIVLGLVAAALGPVRADRRPRSAARMPPGWPPGRSSPSPPTRSTRPRPVAAAGASRRSCSTASPSSGGAIGGWVGLLALHHKTRHPIFPLVLAVALTVQVAIGIAIGW